MAPDVFKALMQVYGWREGHPKNSPSRKRYRKAFRMVRKRYPRAFFACAGRKGQARRHGVESVTGKLLKEPRWYREQPEVKEARRKRAEDILRVQTLIEGLLPAHPEFLETKDFWKVYHSPAFKAVCPGAFSLDVQVAFRRIRRNHGQAVEEL